MIVHDLGQQVHVSCIAFDDRDFAAGELGNDAQGIVFRVHKVVDDDHIVASGDQRHCSVAADVACAAGY